MLLLFIHFWQWAIEYSAVLILTSNLILDFVLPSSFSLFTISQLSSTVFAFFGLSTIGSSLTFSVLFLLFCYFNILFLFMALCLFIANSVCYANKLPNIEMLQFQKFQLINPDFLSF